MAEYNLTEFRANTRKAFEEAAKGEPVYIERYGEDFILMSKKNYQDTINAVAGSEKNKSDSQANEGELPPPESV